MTTANGHTLSPALRVAVIVPAFNAAATLTACLRALQNQTGNGNALEIIVVDDASTDNTAALAQAMGVTVVQLPVNLGRSGARNAGAAITSAEILLFTDADCEPFSDWAEQMLAPFQRDPDVIGVKGAYRCRQSSLVARFTQLELEDKYDELARQTQIAFIDTYSAAFRRDVFLANGGFDQSLSYSLLEDQDFSFRLAAQGHKMVFAPAAHVYHRHLTSPWRYYRRKLTIGRSKSKILRRHPERMRDDSRTPLSLKAQFVLALLLTPLLPLALFWRTARALAGLLLGAFGVTTVPFLIKGMRRDAAATAVAVPLLLLRAFGLAHGYIQGTALDRSTIEVPPLKTEPRSTTQSISAQEEMI